MEGPAHPSRACTLEGGRDGGREGESAGGRSGGEEGGGGDVDAD